MLNDVLTDAEAFELAAEEAVAERRARGFEHVGGIAADMARRIAEKKGWNHILPKEWRTQ